MLSTNGQKIIKSGRKPLFNIGNYFVQILLVQITKTLQFHFENYLVSKIKERALKPKKKIKFYKKKK